MAVSILAPGQNAAVSTPVVVAAGESKMISLYTDTGVEIPRYMVLTLQRLTVAGFYEDAATAKYGTLQFSSTNKSMIISGEGTYRVKRVDISDGGVNIGVQEG